MSATATFAPAHAGCTARDATRYTAVLPTTEVYIRRRLLVGLVVFVVAVFVVFGAGNVLANRGGAPASTPTVRPAAASATYVARSGDTLWSIAAAHHGTHSLSSYVDALIEANGGTSLQVGQVVALP